MNFSFITFAIVAFFCFFGVVSAVVDNQCADGEQYLEIPSNKEAKFVTPLKKAQLKNVGNRTCGFKIVGEINKDNVTEIHYTAVEIEGKNNQFCSFWEKEAICVCPGSGCNKAHGYLYETLFKSLYNSGTVKGTPTTVLPEDKMYERAELLLKTLEILFSKNQRPANRKKFGHYKNNLVLFEKFEATHPRLFPHKNSNKEAKIGNKKTGNQNGSRGAMVGASTVVATTQPAEAADNKLVLGLIIGGVVLLVLLVVAVVACLLCRRKKKSMSAQSTKSGADIKKNEPLQRPPQVPAQVAKAPEKPNVDKQGKGNNEQLPETSEIATGGNETSRSDGNFRPLGAHDHVELNSEALKENGTDSQYLAK